MPAIPASHQDIFDKKSFAHIATVSEQGVPQVTPVWIDYDGEHILFNTARGRKKDRNLKANPQISMSIQDPDNGYRYIGIQGRVVEDTEEGAEAHINKLSNKYFGKDYPHLHQGEVRVIYKVQIDNVWTMG